MDEIDTCIKALLVCIIFTRTRIYSLGSVLWHRLDEMGNDDLLGCSQP